MLRQISKFIGNHRGQGIVEFAIVLPILLTIVLGIINFGFVMYQTMIANEAAREAGRITAVTGTRASGIAAAQKFGSSYSAQITPATTPSSGDEITVQVTTPAVIFAPGYKFSGLPTTVSATAHIRLEQTPTTW